jgi:anti-sigma factor RsiW
MEAAAMKCDETGELLDAYHDGELQPSTLAAVGTHLRTCASCSGALAKHETLRLKVRSLGRSPAPAALESKIRRSFSKADALGFRLNARAIGAIAASHLLAIGLGAMVVFGLLHDGDARNFQIQETIDAHVRSMIDERTLMQIASSDSHNVRPWFMGKLNFSPPVAELNTEEFPLLGARVDYIGDRYVAALVYARRKHRINLFVAPAGRSEGNAVRSATRNGYNLLEWQSSGLSFRAVSDIEAAELAQFAELVRARNRRS